MENLYWTAKDEENGTGPFLLPRTHAAVNRNDTSQILVGNKHWVRNCVKHTANHNKKFGKRNDWIFAHGKDWKEKLLKKLSQNPLTNQ
jgi:hypothetical protein